MNKHLHFSHKMYNIFYIIKQCNLSIRKRLNSLQIISKFWWLKYLNHLKFIPFSEPKGRVPERKKTVNKTKSPPGVGFGHPSVNVFSVSPRAWLLSTFSKTPGKTHEHLLRHDLRRDVYAHVQMCVAMAERVGGQHQLLDLAMPCLLLCDKRPTLELPGVLLSLLRTSPRHTGMTDIATASFMWQQHPTTEHPCPILLWQLTIST